MFTHRPTHIETWRLAGPMILSNLSIPLLGLVDTAVMGHMSEPYYLGAVAIGALIFSFIYWGFGFLRMGTTGLVAQAHGADNHSDVRSILARASVMAITISVLLLLLQGAIERFSWWVLEASEQVEFYASVYFDIRIWSAPATLINYVLIGCFLGMQNARGPLYLLLVVNTSNIILDLWFVWGLNMDVAGVALASVIAEYIGAVVGVVLLKHQLSRYEGVWQLQSLFDRRKMRQMVVLNHNIFIRTLCLIFSFAFFTAQGAKYGDVVLAANAVLMNFQTFMAYGLDGFAHAAEAMVGKAIGQRDRLAFKRAVYTAGVWSAVVAALFVLIYGLFGSLIIQGLTDIEAVRQTSMLYLPWLVAAPLLSVWSYLYDGVFVGATRSAEMRNTMLVSTVIFFLPAWYVLQPWGNHGLWAALMVFMVARGITMAFSYHRINRGEGFA